MKDRVALKIIQEVRSFNFFLLVKEIKSIHA